MGERPGRHVAPQTMAEIDRVIHEPARLAILALLAVVDGADFVFVRSQTGLTLGNLSSHMTKLEEAGYLSVDKQFVGRRPRTMLEITEQGRTALLAYRKRMQEVLNEIPG